MRQVCNFNKDVDIQKTRPGLCTSIRLAIESGVVMDSGIDVFPNDIEDPSGIWGRIQDVFTALDVQKKMLSRSVSNSNVQSNVQSSQPDKGKSE